MKAKELKVLRKKLAKANKTGINPLDNVPKETLVITVRQDPLEALEVHFSESNGLTEEQFQACLSLFERNMGSMYRESSWGLNLDDKTKELKHKNARFLLLHSKKGTVDAFVHYRFDYDNDENPSHGVLYVYEIQIDSTLHRRGVGKKLMGLAETLARNAEMTKVMLTVFKKNQPAMQFYHQLGYCIDQSSPSKYNEPADYEILSHILS